MKIIELQEVDSTNEYCKRQPPQNMIVLAARQTAGRGTKGRSFCSDTGGLYFSVMRTYEDFPADKVFKILVRACVAVCKTLEYFGLKPQIRWANDVLVGGKKICGALIENVFLGAKLSRSIVGIGLNINNALPTELEPTATTVQKELKKPADIAKVREVLLENLDKDFEISDYKSYMGWLGSEVAITTADKKFIARALDINYDGRLKCLVDGREVLLSSAEVSLRL